MVIGKGHEPHALGTIANGGGRSTWFLPREKPLAARKRWIADALTLSGSVTVDDGAAKALLSGKSLLPAGVVEVNGTYDRGDAIRIMDMAGRTLGVGLAAYGHEDTIRIKGRKSSEIRKLLGFDGRAELIHRDDLALHANDAAASNRASV